MVIISYWFSRRTTQEFSRWLTEDLRRTSRYNQSSKHTRILGALVGGESSDSGKYTSVPASVSRWYNETSEHDKDGDLLRARKLPASEKSVCTYRYIYIDARG